MKKTFRIEDVPTEVQKVWVLQHFCEMYKTGVGSKLWNECQDTINKYPEWFPNTIAKETHLENTYNDDTEILGTEDGI